MIPNMNFLDIQDRCWIFLTIRVNSQFETKWNAYNDYKKNDNVTSLALKTLKHWSIRDINQQVRLLWAYLLID